MQGMHYVVGKKPRGWGSSPDRRKKAEWGRFLCSFLRLLPRVGCDAQEGSHPVSGLSAKGEGWWRRGAPASLPSFDCPLDGGMGGPMAPNQLPWHFGVEKLMPPDLHLPHSCLSTSLTGGQGENRPMWIQSARADPRATLQHPENFPELLFPHAETWGQQSSLFGYVSE